MTGRETRSYYTVRSTVRGWAVVLATPISSGPTLRTELEWHPDEDAAEQAAKKAAAITFSAYRKRTSE